MQADIALIKRINREERTVIASDHTNTTLLCYRFPSAGLSALWMDGGGGYRMEVEAETMDTASWM